MARRAAAPAMGWDLGMGDGARDERREGVGARSAAAPAERRGVLHLVVGPSGAGKDTLIDAVRRRRPDIHAARRVITRPADAGGEDHEATSEAAFAARAAAGGFLLSWRAHGLSYGAPATLDAVLRAPSHVLLNVSRRVVDEARARLAPVRILFVTAPREILAQRLAERGRESAAEIFERLRRQAGRDVSGPDVYRIDNAGPLEAGLAAMLAACAPPLAPPTTPRPPVER